MGSNWSPCSTRPEPPSVLRVRADCGGRFFTTKLGVVLHYLLHQVFDAIAGVAGTVGRCNGLRVRSLNDPHDAGLRPFNRHILEPRNSCIRCKLDASVTIRPPIPTPVQRVSPI